MTSGTLSVTGLGGGPHFSFSGTNFSVTGGGPDTGSVFPQTACDPCKAGDTINVSAFLGGQTLGGGTATFDGVSYTGGFNGLFQFSGPSIVVLHTVKCTFTKASSKNSSSLLAAAPLHRNERPSTRAYVGGDHYEIGVKPVSVDHKLFISRPTHVEKVFYIFNWKMYWFADLVGVWQ